MHCTCLTTTILSAALSGQFIRIYMYGKVHHDLRAVYVGLSH